MTLSRKPVFWAVGFGHMAIDMFNGMGPVLMAFLSGHILSMSNTQIGLAVSAYNIGAALTQPLFGWMGDRNGGRWLAAGGLAWTVSLLVLSLAVAQLTGSYILMLIPFVLASFGSGAFHPVGAMHAADSDRERAAANTSIFFMFGQTGLAIGPALAGFLLDRVATHNNLTFTDALGPAFQGVLIERGTVVPVLLLALVAVPAALFMARAIPSAHRYIEARGLVAKVTATAAKTAFPVRAFVLLALVVALRSLINPGIIAFLPRLFEQKGWSAAEYGLVTSMFWIGGGIAGIVIGYLADRFDSRLLVAVTLILSAPALFILAALNTPLAFVLALATGALSGGSHSLLVVQAQGLIPGSKGFASGAILGFMFTTGAIGSLIIGWMSDQMGLEAAFQIVAGVTVVTGLLGLALPPDKRFGIQAAAPASALEPSADSVSA